MNVAQLLRQQVAADQNIIEEDEDEAGIRRGTTHRSSTPKMWLGHCTAQMASQGTHRGHCEFGTPSSPHQWGSCRLDGSRTQVKLCEVVSTMQLI
jgi:hypothetical protein